MAVKNPLRYPGAKSKLYNYVEKLLKQENLSGCTFCEPFAGSASLSFMLLESNSIKSAIINEKDPLLYYFWKAVFDYPQELIQLVLDTEISIENWYDISKFRSESYLSEKSTVEKGFACLFLNRTNFSGILNANPLGGKQQKSQYKIDCRFNKSRIVESIRQLSGFADRIQVYNLDALDFMRQNLQYRMNDAFFVYVDPPYYKAGPELYRYFYKKDDHAELSNYLKSMVFPWLISYDDTPEIRNLYSQSKFIDLYLDYSVRTTKKGQELLISNLEIPPIESDNIQVSLEMA